MRRIIAFMLVAVLALTGGGLATSNNALAHEHRAVGDYELTVGFLNEPSIAFQPNGLSLEVKLFPNGVPAEGGFPANRISEILGTIDPTTAEKR